MSEVIRIKLKHNYKQFDGMLFKWMHLSATEIMSYDNEPSFEFELPDGRVISAAIELQRRTGSRGINEFWTSSQVNSLQSFYVHDDWAIDKDRQQINLQICEHAAQYYPEKLRRNGFVYILYLVKI